MHPPRHPSRDLSMVLMLTLTLPCPAHHLDLLILLSRHFQICHLLSTHTTNLLGRAPSLCPVFLPPALASTLQAIGKPDHVTPLFKTPKGLAMSCMICGLPSPQPTLTTLSLPVALCILTTCPSRKDQLARIPEVWVGGLPLCTSGIPRPRPSPYPMGLFM